MKVDEALLDVIDLCTKIDGKSAAIYNNFSSNSRDETIRKMWKEMSGEEREHAEGWQRLLAFVKEGSAFYVFDEPLEIRNELKSILSRVDTFLEQSKYLDDISSAFVIACNLELYMLHRSFISLFYYLQTVSSSDHNFGENYGGHLSSFITALNKYGLSPELKVLGEAIQRLWKDNNDLVIQSNRDFLTGVFNRRGFFQAVIPLAFMAQREGNNVGVMMIDGDDFKKVNDNYGHQAGDEVLKLIANSIKNHVRRSDLVGRYGGEEFVVFLSNIQPDHLFEVAEKIRKEIELESSSGIPVTVSIGIAQKVLGKNADTEVEGLIKKADDYLYEAKNSGKNRIVGDASSAP